MQGGRNCLHSMLEIFLGPVFFSASFIAVGRQGLWEEEREFLCLY